MVTQKKAKQRSSKSSGGYPDFSHESEALASGAAFVAGVDEVGRGCLAGPVVAAAVILDPACAARGFDFPDWLRRVRDSKLLSEAEREALVDPIRSFALASAVGVASEEEIDRLNILHASHLAMVRALDALAPRWRPLHAIIDGHLIPKRVTPGLASTRFSALVKGDLKSVSVACASILAKVHRDHEMGRLSQIYPEFQLDRHKGYPTPEHLSVLDRFGPTPIHRKSFAPVRERLKTMEVGTTPALL
jgi:ribonuclease HII